MSTSLAVNLLGGAALRASMLAWGHYQDAHTSLRFEDVDYSVFTDAARLVVRGCPLQKALAVDAADAMIEENAYGPNLPCARGMVPIIARFVLQQDPRSWSSEEQEKAAQDTAFRWALFVYKLLGPLLKTLSSLGDPYARPTYRYTPFLAVLLSPIYSIRAAPRDLGKCFFLIADLACGVLMWQLVQGRRRTRVSAKYAARIVSLLWFFNPMPMQIAARGSAESILGFLVLLFLYLFLQNNPELPPEGLAAAQDQLAKAHGAAQDHDPRPVAEAAEPLSEWSLTGLAAPIVLAIAVHFKIYPIVYAAPIVAHLFASTGGAKLPIIRFTIVAGFAFAIINLVAYGLWGTPFIEHSFLYHIHRKDHRHNFSAFFLPTYLSTVPSTSGQIAGNALSKLLPAEILTLLTSPLASFVPQLLLVAYLGFSIGSKDLVAAFFAQTMAFVHWNKVITSQYFLWYLWLLPVLLPDLDFGVLNGLVTLGGWISSQALWLSQAYLLENKAQDNYLRVWLAGLVFLTVQAWVLVSCVKAWGRVRLQDAAMTQMTAAKAASSVQ
ncbi:glycosyltransferase family 50 protein [Tilletiaria anomala UBC 951]|uniref:GPI mannosyltransferase 1 n=1 Tax=Tilletiaria anomala (strain ATCC 24038 / CBS 436.72 / UBC 951) TaxID=1037660 RepID=A0A066V1J1_TILAU|nr:glycosyltransferase family 50 protein [Tilletiaria anomala UBC 951]KDN35577.1 glycosyltransferase family 50 protein [Tilletiaria anomala UBC 951]